MHDFGWTLTVTDCTTGWTEAGAVRTKAECVCGRCPGDLPPQVSGAGHLSPCGQRKRGPRPATSSVSAMPVGSPSPPSPFVPRILLSKMRGVLQGEGGVTKNEPLPVVPAKAGTYFNEKPTILSIAMGATNDHETVSIRYTQLTQYITYP